MAGTVDGSRRRVLEARSPGTGPATGAISRPAAVDRRHSLLTMAVLPMFPLGTVLLPGAVLPLHVFEPRYRQLVQDCLAGEPEFGVVLIERGSEVGGGDQRATSARWPG